MDFRCTYSKKCMEILNANTAPQNRLSFIGLEKSEQDLILLGILKASKLTMDKTARGKQRERAQFRYKFVGHEICLTAFRHVFNGGTKRFDNLRKH